MKNCVSSQDDEIFELWHTIKSQRSLSNCRSRSQKNYARQSKLSTEFPQKFPRNVLRVFDVCSEMQSDCGQYFGFVVEEFDGISGVSELVDCWAFSLLETVTSGSRKNRERGDVRRICPLQIFRVGLYFQTNIKYSQYVLTTLSVGIRSRLFKVLF